jgi:hypothetical protein
LPSAQNPVSNPHHIRRENNGMSDQPGRLVFLTLVVIIIVSLVGALLLIVFRAALAGR